MIGILELEREDKRRAKLEKQLAKSNRSQFDDEQKKLKFFKKFCDAVRIWFLAFCADVDETLHTGYSAARKKCHWPHDLMFRVRKDTDPSLDASF